MTHFFSPSRRRMGNIPDGRPCWLQQYVALPALHLTPDHEMEGQWVVELILVDHWLGIVIGPLALAELLQDWRDGPEEALKKWFKADPPEALAAPLLIEDAGTASASAEELDL